jgi:hypothetical protein
VTFDICMDLCAAAKLGAQRSFGLSGRVLDTLLDLLDTPGPG